MSRMPPHDFLLLSTLLRKHKLRVRNVGDSGTRALLPSSLSGGGGTVQGLGVSTALYGAVPVALAHLAHAEVPCPALVVNDMVYKVFGQSFHFDTCPHQAIFERHLQIKAFKIEAALEQRVTGLLSKCAVQTLARQCFDSCVSDAERVWLLDLCATQADEITTLVVDDVHMRASHPAMFLRLLNCLDTYAVQHGVVFETGTEAKSVILTDGLDCTDRAKLTQAVQQSIQGGSPILSDHPVFLGVPHTRNQWSCSSKRKGASKDLAAQDAQIVLKSIDIKAAIARQVACSTARSLPWPLVGRRFYLTFAFSRIAYLAPLALMYPCAGVRFSMLQERWAISVVRGLCTSSFQDRLPKHVRATLLQDRGWVPLWRRVQAIAVTMMQKMLAALLTSSFLAGGLGPLPLGILLSLAGSGWIL